MLVAVTALAAGLFAAPTSSTAAQSPAAGTTVTQLAATTPVRMAAVTGWRPTPGAKFNVARAGGEKQFRLENQVIAAVNRAKPKSTIKMAMFSFDRHPVADALIAAKRRGVYVQVIVNGHEFPSAQRRLRRVLGPRTVKVVYVDENGEQQTRIRQRRNFFYQCVSSCRGDGDVQHSKFVLFTRTGIAEHVVMLGSVNMKLNGARNQFNDLLTINDNVRLHAALDEVFDEMRMDKVLADSYRKYTIGERYQLEVMPYPRTKATTQTRWTADRDPIVRLLKPIRCFGARTDTGRTIVRVNMHAWDGTRGKMLANKFRDLYAAGCDVKIHVGFAGRAAREVFARPTRRGLVPVRSTGYDTDEDGEIDLYSHAKILLVNGNYGGLPGKKMVVTGSSNYQNGGQYGDELILRVFDPKIYRQYADNWGFLWREHTHSFHWGVTTFRLGSGSFTPEYYLYDGLGTNSPEWRDE